MPDYFPVCHLGLAHGVGVDFDAQAHKSKKSPASKTANITLPAG
jgi:hypothetical protein